MVLAHRARAATLAVGTEITDGQVIDRNSAWISQRLVEAGVEVIEHRAVADDHTEIERALKDLSGRVDHLFVTGGLGPTSDDFTRDVLAKAFGLDLVYDEGSWQQIVDKLGKRGVPVREIQRQQCYFPRGARILPNPAGTANAFAFVSSALGRKLTVYALPGPPPEIAAVWDLNLKNEIAALVDPSLRETLRIYRCLGRAESEVAEKTEIVIQGSGLRVGYRAHVPYVEVKLWVPNGDASRFAPVIAQLEAALGEWVTNRNEADVADDFIDRIRREGRPVILRDLATYGGLSERIVTRLRERKLSEAELSLSIETGFGLSLGVAFGELAAKTGALEIQIEPKAGRESWRIRRKDGPGPESELEVTSPYHYNVRGERARRFITEKALHLLTTT